MQFAFRVGHRLFPFVRANRAELGDQLVFAELQAVALGRPVREETHESEGRRAQQLDNRAHSFERFEQLLRAAGRDAIAFLERLSSDRKVNAGCA
jgi:hypothetical protein